MSDTAGTIFKNRWLNGWKLFSIVSIPICALVLYEMTKVDMATGQGVSHMIGYSVRFAVPIIFIVAAASAVNTLFPSGFSKWYLRNRKYIGLTFAVAMAWQGLFIFIISTFTRDYYFEEVYFFRDELEGSIGYIFLVGMIVTSFVFAKKHTNPYQWKLIQKGGLYFLWAYAFSVYWWNLFYYPLQDAARVPEVHDYIFYWMGFGAFALRIAAWGKQRQTLLTAREQTVPVLYKLAGVLFIFSGLVASATGLSWQETTNAFLMAPAWSAELELWVPFWPFTPFLPLMAMAVGTWLYTMAKAETQRAASAAE